MARRRFGGVETIPHLIVTLVLWAAVTLPLGVAVGRMGHGN
jgi:hypothetical protein